jgi:hypothetical protein
MNERGGGTKRLCTREKGAIESAHAAFSQKLMAALTDLLTPSGTHVAGFTLYRQKGRACDPSRAYMLISKRIHRLQH